MAKKSSAAAKTYLHALLTGPPGIGKTTVIKRVCSVLREQIADVSVCGFYTEEVRGGEGGRGGRGRGGRGRGRRGRGGRVGFDVVTLDGQRGVLARVSSSQDQQFPSATRGSRKPAFVGKYQVDVTSFEKTALPTLQRTGRQQHGAHSGDSVSPAPSRTPAVHDSFSGQSKLQYDGAKSEAVESGCVQQRASDSHSKTESQMSMVGLPLQSQGCNKRLVVIDEIGKMELFSQSFVDSVKALFQRRDDAIVVLATIPVPRSRSHWLVEELRHSPDCMLFEVTETNRDSLVEEVTKFVLQRLGNA